MPTELNALDRSVDDWTVASLRDAFFAHGCAIVRGAVDVEYLARLAVSVDRAYQRTSEAHVNEGEIVAAGFGVSGFEIGDQPLLRGLLDAVFRGRENYQPAYVAARRVHGQKKDESFQPPLDLHVDAQYHGPRFVVNFWLPLQACGVDRPTILLVPVDRHRTRAHVGFTGERLRQGGDWYLDWFDLDTMTVDRVRDAFGDDCFLHPVMARGDVVIASSWIIHGSWWTKAMTRGRKSVEVRYIGDVT